MDRRNGKRYAAIFDVGFVQGDGLSVSPLSISAPLPSPAPSPAGRSYSHSHSHSRSGSHSHSRSFSSTPVPLHLDMDKVRALKSRPSPIRQMSLDIQRTTTYSGESHSRTPSGELYKNRAFASALHLPSTPLPLSPPPSVHTPSPLSRTTSIDYDSVSATTSASKETPPTSPEPSEEGQCSSAEVQRESAHGGEGSEESDDNSPIPQSYSVMALWNDYQTNELLQRLTGGSPTFCNYEHPPRRVLDLGCGEGTWIKFAALKWNTPDTHIEGFDITPLWETSRRHCLDVADSATRITWKVGNFLERLPYEQETFDLVRVANLGLSVPKANWFPLLLEIRRILRVGGRLELIDDEFFFPRLRHAAVAQSPRSSKEIDHDEKLSRFWEHEESKRMTEYLEVCFTRMMRTKYGVSAVHDSLQELLPMVFGDENTKKLSSNHIALPRRNYRDTARIFEEAKSTKKVSFSQGSRPQTPHPPHTQHTPHVPYTPDAYGLESMLPTSASQKAVQVLCTGRKSGTGDLPNFLPPKAAKLLATATAPRPYQPDGFLVFPDKFYECRPDVLEMYACRNMHVILSYKRVLGAWLNEHRHELTELGRGLTEDMFYHMFDDAMWQYDCFKRKRLNWPADYPSLLMRVDDDEVEPVSSRGFSGLVERRRRAQSTSCTLVPAVSMDECTQVRVIRVFGATKTR